MKIKLKRYIIATSSRPIEFNTANSGEFTSNIDDAMFYAKESDAVGEVECMDDPELYEIIQLDMAFDF